MDIGGSNDSGSDRCSGQYDFTDEDAALKMGEQMMKRIICWILMMGMLGVVFASNVYAEENVAESDELKTVRVGYLIYEGYQEGAGDAPKSGYGYEYLQQIAYYACGYAFSDEFPFCGMMELLHEADQRMYQDKARIKGSKQLR